MALQDSHMTQNVTRFLPDPTRNPDIDLAHLGYRLATLAALPSSFPVSRVKLADEGFYFRGQGDEMTCYSCHMRYSGWARTDNPVDIHRRFSPQCAHVVRNDSAGNAQSNGHFPAESRPVYGSVVNGDRARSAGSSVSNGHFTTAGTAGSTPLHGALVNGDIARSAGSTVINGHFTTAGTAGSTLVHGALVNGERDLSVGNAPSNGHANAAGNTEVSRVGHTPLVNGAPTVLSTPVENGDGSDPTSRRPASSARATGPSSLRTGASASVTPTRAARGRTTISHSDSGPRTRENNAGRLSMSDSSSGENRASVNGATRTTNVNRTQPINTAPEHDSIDTTDSRPLPTSNGLPRGDTSSNNTRRPAFELSHSDTVGTDSRSLSTFSASSDGETNTSNRPSSNASRSASVRDREGSGGVEARPSLFPQPGLDLGGAVYPMYQDMASRRRTFNQWDDSHAPPLDHVILCGMFYAGYADCVRCFYCGVGLKHWVPTDDVWTEHVRWRPGCGYLRAIKGDDFIEETQRRLGIESSGGPRDTAHNSNTSHAASGIQQPVTAAISTSSSSHRSPMTTSTTAPRSSSPSPQASRSCVSASDTATATVTTGGQTASVSFSAASRNTSNVPRTSRSDPTSQPVSQPTSQPTTVGTGQNPTTSTTALRASTSSDQRTRNVQVTQASQNQSSRTTATDRATLATTTAVTGAATAARTAAAAAASLRRSGNVQGDACDGRQNRVRNVAVESSGEERERLARLRQENNRLSQRLRCRVCHNAPIDTILMPCGHLVLCESCAGSVTSCPLCHDAIRATARVHME